LIFIEKYIYTNNNKLKTQKMAKKVLRYTEEQFITLLENIVKKVKAEETLNESKNPNRTDRRQNLNERFKKLK
jgi:hypothetical protein